MEMTFRPMPEKPAYQPLGRGCSPTATHTRMMQLLRAELVKVKATNVVIDAGFTADDIRQDGMPYSGARPSHSAVRLTFRRHGKTPMSFTCGGHRDWVQNLYLIAMTLERLRAIARYGCVQADQQYRGWAQLPPGNGSGIGGGGGVGGVVGGGGSIAAAEWASVGAAMRFLSGVGDGSVLSVLPADLPTVYRAAARRAHPDSGGSDELMARVNRARDYVESAGRAAP